MRNFIQTIQSGRISRSKLAFLRSPLCFLLLMLLASCGGSGSSPDAAVVNELEGASFSSSRLVLDEGESTLMTWNVVGATSVSISPNIGDVSLAGELEITPEETTTFVLSAFEGGSEIGQKTLTITVRPNASVRLIASVLEGPTPLTVRFTPVVQSSTAINRLYWEFEGNGGDIDGGLGTGVNGFDPLRISNRLREYEVTGRDISFTYDTPGEYPVRVRVWDADGNQDEATVTITVNDSEPTVSMLANTNQGTAPLDVAFRLDAYDENTIELVEWDYDGDGVIDRERTPGNSIYRAWEYFTYENVGQYQPVFRLTDTLGNSNEYQFEHLRINSVEEALPEVTLTITTRTGPAPLEINHRISSYDAVGSRVISYEWDFDGDGSIDFTGDDRSVSYTYTKAGRNLGLVTAVTEDGLRVTNQFEIVTSASFTFDIEKPAINPNIESTPLKLVSTADVEFELVVMSSEGQKVKTLLGKQFRPAGEFTTSWDGSSVSGTDLPPGDYYVVVNAYVDGKEVVFDLRSSTGGDIFYPNGWGTNRRCSGSSISECGELIISDNTLEPFNKKPTTFDISSPHNAKMSAYMTIIGSDNFAATTFFRSRVFGPGDSRLSWYGTGSDGKLLPYKSRNGYLPAIYGITLADNSVVLNNRTELSNVNVAPDILNPQGSSHGNIKSTVEFNLNRKADVTLTVDSAAQGTNVFQKVFRDIPAGANQTLTWDGRDNLGRLVGPGGYAITLSAIDTYGQESIPRKVMQRVDY